MIDDLAVIKKMDVRQNKCEIKIGIKFTFAADFLSFYISDIIYSLICTIPSSQILPSLLIVALIRNLLSVVVLSVEVTLCTVEKDTE